MFMEFFARLIEHILSLGWGLAGGCASTDAQGERLRP